MANVNIYGKDLTDGNFRPIESGDVPTDDAGGGLPVSAHASDHATGGSDAFTSGDVLEATVKRIQESGGATTLTVGAVSDGESLIRDGTNLIGFLGLKRLSTTGGIDATSTGTTNLYTGASGKITIPMFAVVRVTAATAVTVAARAGIGVAAGENDIFAEADMTNLLTTSDAFVFVVGGHMAPVAAAAVVKLGIDAAITGTAQTLEVDLWGYDL